MLGKTVSRRMVVGVLGSGVALAPAIAQALSTEASDAEPARPATATERALALIAPLGPGSMLARWSVVAVYPPHQGAFAVELRGANGDAFFLQILARDRSPLASRPPASTERFAVHVINGGDGYRPTVEEQGLAAMTLATIVAANEGATDAAGFLTHAERITRYGDALLARAVAAPERDARDR